MAAPPIELMRQVPAFKEWVPMWARVVTFLFFIMVFQCSGGIYLASMSEMIGYTDLMREDILMVANAGFVGISMVFPILFRLKFRLVSRTIFPIVACTLIVVNLITMQSRSMPILVMASFLGGFLKMWGTFECFSSIQLRITSTRNFAVFFPVVYLSVFGYIQLSGLATTYLTYIYNWQYMHYAAIGLLLVVILLTRVLLRPFHMAPPLPLYGIDWLGLILWSVILLLVIFVCNYGDYYDWFYSPHIRLATVAALFFLAVNLYRMFRIRHPYIEAATFKYRHIVTMMFLFLALCFLTSTSTILQGAYTGGIFHYDSLNAVALNIPSFIGVLLGALFTWQAITRFKVGYKPMIFIGFSLVVLYQVMMYFLISPDMNIERLYFPSLIKQMGNVIIYIVLTLYLSQTVAYQHFFQSLCAVGFIREGIGTPLASAVIERVFKVTIQENYYTLGSALDAVNPLTSQIPLAEYVGELHRQVMLVSIKEVFGYAILLGLLLLIFILFTRYTKVVHYIKLYRVPVARRLLSIRLNREKREDEDDQE